RRRPPAPDADVLDEDHAVEPDVLVADQAPAVVAESQVLLRRERVLLGRGGPELGRHHEPRRTGRARGSGRALRPLLALRTLRTGRAVVAPGPLRAHRPGRTGPAVVAP